MPPMSGRYSGCRTIGSAEVYAAVNNQMCTDLTR
jgi:hypothetical protein